MFRLLAVYPNPTRERATVMFTLPGPSELAIQVFDVTGRRVRDVFSGTLPGGHQVIAWDGRDEGRRVAASGVYFVRITGEAGFATRKLLITR